MKILLLLKQVTNQDILIHCNNMKKNESSLQVELKDLTNEELSLQKVLQEKLNLLNKMNLNEFQMQVNESLKETRPLYHLRKQKNLNLQRSQNLTDRDHDQSQLTRNLKRKSKNEKNRHLKREYKLRKKLHWNELKQKSLQRKNRLKRKKQKEKALKGLKSN